MWERTDALLSRIGIQPRPFRALAKALLLIDLRGQHYAKATATKPRHVISPLFWVVGQCLTLSAVTSLVLFMRVDVFFYAFAGLAVSMLVVATTVLVEFNEVVLDPRDADIIGHRPITGRTYSAARFANLLFYLALMYVALNLFPLIVGAGLRDAGVWYAPAYLVASLAGHLLTSFAVILLLSIGGQSKQLENWKEILAWTQILLILVVGYGAQIMFRNKQHAMELWAAFPPDWISYLPPAWLARFVEHAAVQPDGTTLVISILLALLTLAAGATTIWWLSAMYRGIQPARSGGRAITMSSGQIGSLANPIGRWLARGREERVGFWLCSTMLRRDRALRMRCLLSLNMAVAVVVLGLFTDQFANPMSEREIPLVTLPILAVYLICLAVPSIVYNFTFSDDSDAAWVLLTAPLDRPAGMPRGMCKTVQLWIVSPMCVALFAVSSIAWGDPLSAALHAGLAWCLSWPIALASLWLVVPAFPLSLPHARGSSLGPLAIPMAAFSAIVMPIAFLHYLFAASAWFWIGAFAVAGIASYLLGPPADRRLTRLLRANS